MGRQGKEVGRLPSWPGGDRDLGSPIAIIAHWDHFQRPQAVPIYRLWASWEVYCGLDPGFPDSSRGHTSCLPFFVTGSTTVGP